MAFFTQAGNNFGDRITVWLQNTRLMSEAVFRLNIDYEKTGRVQFTEQSWSKSKAAFSPRFFSIKPIDLSHRMDSLLKSLWKSQFVFLESLWEEYLQELVLELGDRDVKILDPFCEKDFMVEVIKDVIADKITSVSEIKISAAERFAAGITRQDWNSQWKQLKLLNIGLSAKDAEEKWFHHLDVYFEMRNCIIHRSGKLSPLLKQKNEFYKSPSVKEVEILPGHLDFYRGNFVECLAFIEKKIEAKTTHRKPEEAEKKEVVKKDTFAITTD